MDPLSQVPAGIHSKLFYQPAVLPGGCLLGGEPSIRGSTCLPLCPQAGILAATCHWSW